MLILMSGIPQTPFSEHICSERRDEAWRGTIKNMLWLHDGPSSVPFTLIFKKWQPEEQHTDVSGASQESPLYKFTLERVKAGVKHFRWQSCGLLNRPTQAWHHLSTGDSKREPPVHTWFWVSLTFIIYKRMIISNNIRTHFKTKIVNVTSC